MAGYIIVKGDHAPKMRFYMIGGPRNGSVVTVGRDVRVIAYHEDTDGIGGVGFSHVYWRRGFVEGEEKNKPVFHFVYGSLALENAAELVASLPSLQQ
jgi:hypothetical protein